MIAISAEQAGAAQYNYAAAIAAIGSGGGGGGGGGSSSATGNPETDLPTKPSYDMTGWDEQIIKGYLRYYNRYPDPAGYENFDKSGLEGDELLQAILGASAADKDGIDYKRAVKRGYNPLDPIAKFAVGTNFVPYDMQAVVHKGERIIPAAENSELFARLRNPDQNSAELVSEIRAMRLEITRLQLAASQTAANTGETARTLDNITRESGGDAMKVQVAA
jgi:hypothetical protein